MVRPKSKIYVFLNKVCCGTLSQDEKGYYFSYNDDYIANHKLPISLAMPIKKEKYRPSGLHNTSGYLPEYFESLFPEGFVKNIAEQFLKGQTDRLFMLLILCKTNVGNVSFSEEDKAPNEDKLTQTVFLKASDSSIEENQAATKIEHCLICGNKLPRPGYNQNYHESCSEELFRSKLAPDINITSDSVSVVISDQLKAALSLTGVQAKFSMLLRNRNTFGGANFIVKPEPKDDFVRGMAGLETSIMQFSEYLGLPAAKTTLGYLKDGTPSCLVRRFDYLEDGTRIHMEDFAAINKKLGDGKYHGSLEKIAKVIKNDPSYDENFRKKDLSNFLKIALLNIVMSNADNHLKKSLYISLHCRWKSKNKNDPLL